MTDAPTTTKWTADATLGKIQCKRFNDAVSKYNWEAKTIIERMDSGDHCVTPMFSGPTNPQAEPLMREIHERYHSTVTAANHQDIVKDIQIAMGQLARTRHVVDKRTTPEQRQARDTAREEREAKDAAEAQRVAGMVGHEYSRSETAGQIKRVLGILWPDVRFSVTSESYSGGGAIRAKWKNGPMERVVRRVMDVFQDTHFDGMNDLQTHSGPEEWNGHRFTFHSGYCCQSRECVRNQDEEETDCAPSADIGTEKELGYEAVYAKTRDVVFRILLGEIGHKPESLTSDSNVGENAGRVTLTQNEDKDGLELRFPDKPPAATLERLKNAGWRWSRFSKCWWHRRDPAALVFARQIAGPEEEAGA